MLISICLGILFVFAIALVARASEAHAAVRYAAVELDIGHLVTAIKSVENWDGRTPGAQGEWGPMQMTPAIYKRFASDERAYVRYLLEECRKLRKPPTAWLVGLLHNAGYPAVRDHRALEAKLNFAERVATVYKELSK